MNVLGLFPVGVGRFELGRPISEKELKFVLDQERRPNTGNTTSVTTKILVSPEMASINQFVQDCIVQFSLEALSLQSNLKIVTTQSWLNYSEKGQWHHKHAHPNSFISGVFYIQSSLSDKIYFHKDSYKQLTYSPREFNHFNSETWWLEALPGILYLFPSGLQHSVDPVQEDLTRISLSFNTFLAGQLGSEYELTGIVLNEQEDY